MRHGGAERQRGGPHAAVDHDHEGGVGLLVEAHGVAAVAVEVAGDRPDVLAARGAEGDRRHGDALVVEQVVGGVGPLVEAHRVAAVAVPVAGQRQHVGHPGRPERHRRQVGARVGAAAPAGRARVVPGHAVGPAVDEALAPAGHEGERVDRARLVARERAAHVDLEVDVGRRGGGVAGAADQGDHLALHDLVALGHQVLGVVGVVVGDPGVAPQPDGEPAEPVVGVVDLGDDARLDRHRRRALGGEQVVALVLAGAAGAAAGVPVVAEGDLGRRCDRERVRLRRLCARRRPGCVGLGGLGPRTGHGHAAEHQRCREQRGDRARHPPAPCREVVSWSHCRSSNWAAPPAATVSSHRRHRPDTPGTDSTAQTSGPCKACPGSRPRPLPLCSYCAPRADVVRSFGAARPFG